MSLLDSRNRQSASQRAKWKTPFNYFIKLPTWLAQQYQVSDLKSERANLP